MTEIRFDEQVALVTGAGRGLGRAYAIALAARGARVVVNSRKHADAPGPGNADRVVDAIRADGGEAVADPEHVEADGAGERMVQRALDTWGRIDILVCNAGVGVPRMFHKQTLDEIRQLVNVNLMGTLAPIHAALPHMREAGYGRIIANTSNSAAFGAIGWAVYAATKSAAHGLVASLALEGEARGIHVNALMPFAHTDMTGDLFVDEIFPEGTDERLTTEAVAELALWPLHRDCRINGQIVVAGGRALRLARIVQNRGIVLDDVSPENAAARTDEIERWDDLITYADSESMLTDIARTAIED